MTYDKEFIAVRHESDLLTPLLHAPLVSLSVRELGYVGAFVMCAMLSFSGAAPGWLAAAGLALAAAAFFRWRGELPEAYLYYAALAALAAAGPRSGRRGGRSGGVKKGGRAGRRGRRRGIAAALLGRQEGGLGSAVVGPGVEYVPPTAALPAPRPGGAAAAAAGPIRERIELGAAGAPVDLTLDIGSAHGHAAVTVCVDGAELVRDAANGEGEVTVTMIPRPGVRRFSVLDSGGSEISSRDVEFAAPGEGLPGAAPGGPVPSLAGDGKSGAAEAEGEKGEEGEGDEEGGEDNGPDGGR